MASKWNSVNDLLPPEARVVEVLVQQGYVVLARRLGKKWITTQGVEMRPNEVCYWQDGDREKIEKYLASLNA